MEDVDPVDAAVETDKPVVAAAAGAQEIATRSAPAAKRRVAPASALPEGEAIVRDCFGSPRRENGYGMGSRGSGAGGGGAAKGAPSKPRPQPMRRPAPAPSPSPMDGAASAEAEPAPPPPAAAPPPAEPARKALPAEGNAATGAERSRRPKPDAKPIGGEAKSKKAEDTKSAGYYDEVAEEQADADDYYSRDREQQQAKPEPVLDWGATVYLSNDDSMSLASAQRVLYQAMNNRPATLSEIRPHELLNYFSFDTTAVPEGQLFSVLGSAEQTDDTLTVALSVKGALPPRQPLDLSVAIDRSGSMGADGRMTYTKRALSQMSDNLMDGDRIDIVLFDSKVCTPLENYVVGRDDPQLLTNVINQMSPRGSTDLEGGLSEAYRIQSSRSKADTHGRNQRVMLLTDAMLNTGMVNEHVVSQVSAGFEDQGIRLTGVGVGRDFNDKLLDMLTEKGKGAYVYLGSEAVVDRLFGAGFDALTATIAHDVKFSLELPDSLAMEKFYGEESSTNPDDVQPINYYAGTSQLFLQDLSIRDGKVERNDPLTMKITYREAATGEPGEVSLKTTLGALLDADPHSVRKAKALMSWSDLEIANTMRAQACGAPLEDYRSSIAGLEDDAEMVFVSSLVEKRCGVKVTPIASGNRVAVKVRVDSDIPIAEVKLWCGSDKHSDKLSGSNNIARFEAEPGECTVRLQGAVEMVSAVEVPSTGTDLRCLVRGGRLSCS